MISTVTVVMIWPNQHNEDFIESGIYVTSSSDNDGRVWLFRQARDRNQRINLCFC